MRVTNVRHLYSSGLTKPAIDALIELDTATTNAGNSATKGLGNPASFVWNSDGAGVFPAGNPTRDLVMTFTDPDGNTVSVRTLRGTLTTAAGTIAVTNVSSSGDLSNSYVLVDDGTASVRADITITLGDGRLLTETLSWTAVDVSTAGGTPVTGGGK